MKGSGKVKERIPSNTVDTQRRIHGVKVPETARDRVEKALRESEERYRDLFDSATDIMFTLSLDGVFTSLNPAFGAITGWSQSECLGKQFTPIIHPDDVSSAIEMFERALREQLAFTYELRILSKSGEYLLGEFKCTPQFHDGIVVGIFAIARDVTERKRAERALKISHRLLGIANRRTEMKPLLRESVVEIKYFTHCGAVALHILDENHRTVFDHCEGFSREFFESEAVISLYSGQRTSSGVKARPVDPILPYCTDDGSFYINGTTRFIVRVPEGDEGPVCAMCNELGYESVALLPIRIRDRAFGLLVVADHNEDMLPLEIVKILEGVMVQLGMAIERAQSDEALRESEAKYSALVEQATDGVVIMQDGICCFANNAMTTISGYAVEDLIGTPFTDILLPASKEPTDDETQEHTFVKGVIETNQVYEAKLHRKDGTTRDVEVSTGTIQYRGRSAVMGIARDITDRKQVEQMKSDFVSLVSHQLKTPVAIIRGYIENILLGLTGPLTDRTKEYLEEMREMSDRNYHLISDLLNVSRIERGVISIDVHPVTLDEIVNSAVHDYHATLQNKGVALNIEGKDDEITVLADREKTVEAISNVVNNAVKFTKDGSITVKMRADGDLGVVEVVDTGRGMPDEIVGKLFTRDQIFSGSPTPESGSGLGLYIAKEFMTLQGGNISVTSTLGKGSSFIFKIPLARNAAS